MKKKKVGMLYYIVKNFFPKPKRKLVMSGIIKKGKVETRSFKYDGDFMTAQERQNKQVAAIHADKF